jgi:periplasmic copper chaperone A
MKRALAAIALCLAIAPPCIAQTAPGATPGATIEIVRPFARATAATARTGVAYLTIVNNGASDDRLVAASSPVAEKAEPHSTVDDKGVMRMRAISAVEVKAGTRTELKPGGVHLMLIGLKRPLKQGQTFALTLTFEKAGAIETTVTVEAAGANTGHDMKGMKM